MHSIASQIDYGLDVANAIAMARGYRPLHRVVLKTLQAMLPQEGSAEAVPASSAESSTPFW